MQETNYQFEDFLMSVNEAHKEFVLTVHETLLQKGCKVKIESSKTALFKVKYTQGRRGIFNFTLRKKSLKASVYANNFAQYHDVLNSLPASMVGEIAKAAACKNMAVPPTCLEGCVGYTIPIREEQHEKCKFGCFQFDVNAESSPFLLALLESELKERSAWHA